MLTPVALSLSAYYLVILKPPVFVSTAQAFAEIDPKSSTVSLVDLVQLPVAEWEGKVSNDFEPGVMRRFPAIQQAKQLLIQKGANFALMSGTGASVYGIFDHQPSIKSWNWPYEIFTMPLK